MAHSTNVSRIFGFISSAAVLLLFLNNFSTNASPIHRPAKCTVCSDADRARCPVVTPGPDCEVIDEPNCGCCKMCAKKRGENCGVATGLCETGLECIPPPMTSEEYRDYGPADYFRQAAMGDFICVTRQEFLDILSGVAYGDENVEEIFVPELYDTLEDLVGNEDETPTNSANVEEDESEMGPVIPELEPVTSEMIRPTEPPTAPFPDTEKPCIYHADKVWGKLHFDHHEWIPSCEKDGTYFPEQCELSFGRERGRCWCVDHLGTPVSKFIPGKEASPELCLPKVNET